jgi:predicted AlkP superfamily phosphohydrolase/phosphomutase
MILVIGLDALDPDLVERFRDEGRLPTLTRLADEGWSGRLRSTFPPVSVPAWSTFLTGVGPGRHGLFDFTRLENGRIRFQNGADRGVPTLLEIADEAGRRVCSLGVPTTYPVPRLRSGAVLAGFDSPFSGRPDSRGLVPTDLWHRLVKEGLDLSASTVPEGRKGRGWHARAARGIVGSIERRVTQVERLLREGPWDLIVVHFQAADTAGHHFFRYLDRGSPRHRDVPARARVIPEVYDALDDAVARLISSAGPEDDVVILSDHGMGPASDRVCYLNRWLEERGYLTRRSTSRSLPLPDLAGRIRRTAIRRLPRGLQASLFRRLRAGPAARLESAARLGSLDLERSAAFSEEASTLPGVWLLDASRQEELIRELRGWEAVVRVYRREDLYRGPYRERAPDVLLELRHGSVRTPPSYLGPSVRALAEHEMDGERGAGLNGVHRPEGVIYACGPGFPGRGRLERAWIGDLAPTLLARIGVPVPSWMEGRPLPALSDVPSWTDSHRPAAGPPPGGELTPREAERLERRLRALGYLG